MKMTSWAGVVLAAGRGTRMRSRLPKVLHPVAGKGMLRWVLDAVSGAGVTSLIVVVGPEMSKVESPLGDGVQIVLQKRRLGTGHALLQSQPLLEGKTEHLLVVNGDMPLISDVTLRRMMAHHIESKAVVTFLTSRADDPKELGRVARNEKGQAIAIIEHREATPNQREIAEVCCGAYCFRSEWLWPRLKALPIRKNGEHYLTDLVGEASGRGEIVETTNPGLPEEGLGINDRIDLAQATAIAYQRTREGLMAQGVTLIDPTSTFIDSMVEMGMDTLIHPNTTVRGATKVGEACEIGPQAVIIDAVIGDRCRVQGSVIEGSVLEDGVEVGPFCHIRPGSRLEKGVHLGNYVEVKKSHLGRDTKVGHFSYLGDATLGVEVNIGAGTVTCNYDGVRKNPTVIGDGAFIGCDSMLVAPVTIGARAVTGAGAVVTHDVPPDTLVVGVPARVTRELSERPSSELKDR